jgi:hypothetical protein
VDADQDDNLEVKRTNYVYQKWTDDDDDGTWDSYYGAKKGIIRLDNDDDGTVDYLHQWDILTIW